MSDIVKLHNAETEEKRLEARKRLYLKMLEMEKENIALYDLKHSMHKELIEEELRNIQKQLEDL